MNNYVYSDYEFSVSVIILKTGESEYVWSANGKRGGKSESQADSLAMRAALDAMKKEWTVI